MPLAVVPPRDLLPPGRRRCFELFARSLRGGGPFHEGDFGVGETIELIDELIDLAVGGVDLLLQHRPGMPACSVSCQPRNAMSSLSHL